AGVSHGLEEHEGEQQEARAAEVPEAREQRDQGVVRVDLPPPHPVGTAAGQVQQDPYTGTHEDDGGDQVREHERGREDAVALAEQEHESHEEHVTGHRQHQQQLRHPRLPVCGGTATSRQGVDAVAGVLLGMPSQLRPLREHGRQAAGVDGRKVTVHACDHPKRRGRDAEHRLYQRVGRVPGDDHGDDDGPPSDPKHLPGGRVAPGQEDPERAQGHQPRHEQTREPGLRC
ncbi:unnamed protein product, partial [Ixodes hexagonus]